jgi:selenocysteine-specific elongation factor
VVRSIVIGTAGHIDHGKSALVRALTGTDPDRLKEERERGITIDLGFAHLDVNGASLSFVDVPGHERFVKNMLAGAGGIDAVILVVAADKSVMPQTREHFEICRLLNVPAGLIALTKSDLADHEMRQLAAIEVRELVAGSFLDRAPIVEVSSRTGEGLDVLRSELVALTSRTRIRSAEGPVRLPIDRVFSMRGFGTVVTGTLVSGCVREEQDLVVMRHDGTMIATKARGIQTHGRAARAAGAGSRVAVNLAGIETSDLARGDTLCTPAAFVPARTIDVQLDLLPEAPPLTRGRRVRFHQGASEVLGRVTPAGAGRARIRLEAPAVVTRGDRFILRAYSPMTTIGGGAVVDPQPPRGAVRGETQFDRLMGGDEDALQTFVEERGEAGLARTSLVTRCGLSEPQAAALVERVVRSGAIVVAGDVLVPPDVLSRLSDRVIAELEAHHRANPLSEGMPREEARERIFHRAAYPVFEAVLDRLVAARKIVARDRLALAGHALALSPEEARVRTALDDTYRQAHLTPLDPAAVVQTIGTTRPVVDRVIALLLRDKTLVKVETLLFHRTALETLKDDVRRMKREGVTTRVDVASFKERFGVTRKYAIPLLEYLDRERVTRRVGDARVVI